MMDGVTKPANHESRKPVTRAGRAEGRGTRVVNNQKHKHRGNGKLSRDGDVSSPTIVKKGKPTESCDATTVDSRSCKENSVNCTSGSANAGQGHQDSCNTRAKKSSPPRAGNLSQPRTPRSEQSGPQSKEAAEALKNQSLIAQHQASPESCPETKKDIIRSDHHVEPSLDQETSPVTSSPPCEYTAKSWLTKLHCILVQRSKNDFYPFH